MWKRILLRIMLFIIFFGGTAFVVNYISYRGYQNVSVEMTEATLPVVYLSYDDQMVDRMVGYSQTLDTGLLRDTIIPVGDDKQVEFLVDDNNKYTQTVSYELRSLDGESLIETDELSNGKRSGGYMQYTVNFRMDMTANQEYVFVVKLNHSEEESIRYYSRIVRLNRNHTNDFLAYATGFNRDTFVDKSEEAAVTGETATIGDAEQITNYLLENVDVNQNSDDTNLGCVTLKSSYDVITWGALNPTITSEVIPSIREIDADNAVIQLKYVVESGSFDKVSNYIVNEFYKLKYDNSTAKIILQEFERHTETVFEYNSINTSENSINIGINDSDYVEYNTTEDKKKAAFVSGGQLWFYDYKKTTISNVYGFWLDELLNASEIQNQSGISIINMTDDGIMDFVVYGRFNRGNHEGENGVMLYEYNEEKMEIQELAYIKSDTPYDVLKTQIGKLSYYDSENQMFYAIINETLVEFNVKTGDIVNVYENLPVDMVYVSSDKKMVAYPNSNEPDKVTEITVRNFETNKSVVKSATAGDRLSIIGFIGEDLVYGEASENNVGIGADGCAKLLFSTLYIIDQDGFAVKNYYKEGILISNADIQTEIIYLKRSSVSETGTISETTDDYISYKPETEGTEITFKYIYSEKEYNQLQLVFPANIYVQSVPEEVLTKLHALEEHKTNSVDGNVNTTACYLFGNSGYKGMYFSVGDAVTTACESGGMVFDGVGNVIYKTKEVASYYTVAGNFSYQSCDSKDQSLMACCYMSLLSAGLSADYNNVIVTNDWIKSFEGNNGVSGINLSGVDLVTALGYLSEGIPFAVKIDDGRFVLVVSYNSTHIRYYDPVDGQEKKVPRKNFVNTMKENGNAIYTYIKY